MDLQNQQQLVQTFLFNFKYFINEFLFKNYDFETINLEYKKLYNEYNNIINNDKISKNIKNYILSQFYNIGEINNYNIPVIKMFYERILERYNDYFKLLYKRSDILITDLNYLILTEITPKYFKIPYGDENIEIKNEYNGIRYGTQGRILFSMPVTYKNKTKQCTFLFDTGSKENYLSEEYLNLFGIDTTIITSSFNIIISGIKTSVNCSDDERIKGINLIGDQFMFDSKGFFSIDYSDEFVTPKIKLK